MRFSVAAMSRGTSSATETMAASGVPAYILGSMRRLRLIGQIFGRLTVIDDGISKGGRYHYLCRCECGKTSRVLGKNLTNGNSQSCGCVARSMNVERMAKQARIHGGRSSVRGRERALYSSWQSMRQRCFSKHKSFKQYGGRGIQMSAQ